MTRLEFINTVKNHEKYLSLKNDIINRPVGSTFNPRYDKDNKLSSFIMRMLLQELKDDGIIDTFLYGSFIRLDK